MYNKIIEIMEKNKEIITSKELEKKGISRVYLSKMEQVGLINKIERGVYSTKKYKYDEYYLFQLRYSKSIFSHNTSLYFHGISERTPIKMDVTISQKYNPHRFKDNVYVHKVNNSILNLGVIEITSPYGMKVKTYNVERTICDIIKDRDSIDIELRNKAIKKAIKLKEFDSNKLFEYAKKLKIYDKVKIYMEAII